MWICHSCNKPIEGKVISALGHDWHPEHFLCNICKRQMDTSTPIREKDGNPVCIKCSKLNNIVSNEEFGKKINQLIYFTIVS